MAGTAVAQDQNTAPVRDSLRQEHNKLVDDLETLRARVNAICAKLDADAGVTDTNYTAGTYGSTSAISTATVLTGAKVTLPYSG